MELCPGSSNYVVLWLIGNCEFAVEKVTENDKISSDNDYDDSNHGINKIV